MSRQRFARHLSFVSRHFSIETLSLSYILKLILTTRPLGVRCSCDVQFLFQVSVLICIGASCGMPEHATLFVCLFARLCMNVFRKQALAYKYCFFSTFSNQPFSYSRFTLSINMCVIILGSLQICITVLNELNPLINANSQFMLPPNLARCIYVCEN